MKQIKKNQTKQKQLKTQILPNWKCLGEGNGFMKNNQTAIAFMNQSCNLIRKDGDYNFDIFLVVNFGAQPLILAKCNKLL